MHAYMAVGVRISATLADLTWYHVRQWLGVRGLCRHYKISITYRYVNSCGNRMNSHIASRSQTARLKGGSHTLDTYIEEGLQSQHVQTQVQQKLVYWRRSPDRNVYSYDNCLQVKTVWNGSRRKSLYYNRLLISTAFSPRDWLFGIQTYEMYKPEDCHVWQTQLTNVYVQYHTVHCMRIV